jgi:hypothetical protein
MNQFELSFVTISVGSRLPKLGGGNESRGGFVPCVFCICDDRLGCAGGGCRQRPLAPTESSFQTAILTPLPSTGVTSVTFALFAGTDLALSTVAPHQFLAFVSGKLNRLFVRGEITHKRSLAALDRGEIATVAFASTIFLSP